MTARLWESRTLPDLIKIKGLGLNRALSAFFEVNLARFSKESVGYIAVLIAMRFRNLMRSVIEPG